MTLDQQTLHHMSQRRGGWPQLQDSRDSTLARDAYAADQRLTDGTLDISDL